MYNYSDIFVIKYIFLNSTTCDLPYRLNVTYPKSHSLEQDSSGKAMNFPANEKVSRFLGIRYFITIFTKSWHRQVNLFHIFSESSSLISILCINEYILSNEILVASQGSRVSLGLSIYIYIYTILCEVKQVHRF